MHVMCSSSAHSMTGNAAATRSQLTTQEQACTVCSSQLGNKRANCAHNTGTGVQHVQLTTQDQACTVQPAAAHHRHAPPPLVTSPPASRPFTCTLIISSYGCCQVSSSHMTTPKLNTSAGRDTVLLRITSGADQRGLVTWSSATRTVTVTAWHAAGRHQQHSSTAAELSQTLPMTATGMQHNSRGPPPCAEQTP